MIDCDATLRTFLVGKSEITDLTGQRIYAASVPPEYRPDQGEALLLENLGIGQDYSSVILAVPYRIRSFGLKEKGVRTLDRILFDNLNEAKSSKIRSAELTTGGQILQDTTTKWWYAMSNYLVVFENS